MKVTRCCQVVTRCCQVVVLLLRMRGDADVGRGNVARFVVVGNLRFDEFCREARDIPRPATFIG